MDAANSKALYEKEKLIKKEFIQHFILGNLVRSPHILGALYYHFAVAQ